MISRELTGLALSLKAFVGDNQAWFVSEIIIQENFSFCEYARETADEITSRSIKQSIKSRKNHLICIRIHCLSLDLFKTYALVSKACADSTSGRSEREEKADLSASLEKA